MLRDKMQLLLAMVALLSLTGCMPPLQASSGDPNEAQTVVELTKADLARYLGVGPEDIILLDVLATEFADSSLGVREPGQLYLQVITPGYTVRLGAKGKAYVYRGTPQRVVRAPEEQDPPARPITIERAQVTPTHIVISGRSTLPNGTYLQTRLLMDGQRADWWPADQAVKVKNGLWRSTVALGEDDTSTSLDTSALYTLRAQQQDDPSIESEPLYFDLAGPKTPEPVDVTLLLPDCAHILDQVSVDIDGDRQMEIVALAGFGRSPGRLDHDWLQLFVIEPDRAAEYAIAYQSDHLAGDRGEKLAVRDINGDDRLEVLSQQSMGAAGETLYILARLDQSFYFLRPQGGAFGGLDRFGDNAVRLQDCDRDGIEEILAHYGPAACQFDIYRWNGQDYVYAETRSAS
jgi:hypothetical protein